MKNKNAKSLPSFTLSETLVSLVISFIVVSIAFTVVGLVRKSMYRERTLLNQHMAFHALHQVLWQDMHTFHKVTFDGQRKELIMANGSGVVTYNLGFDRIIRQRDTLDAIVSSYELFRGGQPVTQGKIDALRLTLAQPEPNTIMVFQRPSSEFYMD